MISTDNVPNNGHRIKDIVYGIVNDFVLERKDETLQLSSLVEYFESTVVFHNTMVDRITSFRKDNPEIPRAEPLPKKALVIEDLKQVGGGFKRTEW